MFNEDDLNQMPEPSGAPDPGPLILLALMLAAFMWVFMPS